MAASADALAKYFDRCRAGPGAPTLGFGAPPNPATALNQPQQRQHAAGAALFGSI